MRVYNLTSTALEYRGKRIPPGDFLEFPVLDKFLPDKDRALVQNRIIAVGSLPSWYTQMKALEAQRQDRASGVTAAKEAKASFVKAAVMLQDEVKRPATQATVERKEPVEKKLEDGWVEKPITGAKNKLK